MNIKEIYANAVNENKICNICNKKLTLKDVEINNIIMTINKNHKNFAHKTCLIGR